MIGRVLISGGSGLVGKVLTNLLISNGYEVSWLTRNINQKFSGVKMYEWNVEENYIDIRALDTDFIVHLAGENVGDEKWTPQRKQKLVDSRVLSTRLLYTEISKLENKPQAFISASAIGIYGVGDSLDVKVETSQYQDDFLADVTQKWENEVIQFENLNIRTIRLRIGLVLSNEGGVIPKMITPIKYYVGAPLGSGNQMQSWIHIVDLVRMFMWAIQENISGAYNAVAPYPVSNKELTQTIAKAIHKPLILPNIPEFALKYILGEMSEIVVNGCYVSCKKVMEDGFVFHFTDVKSAVKNILQ